MPDSYAGRATEDGFLGGRLRILQPIEGYRAGMDAVMLAAACPARPGERVLELGSGTGVASLCLASRLDGLDMVGVEREAEPLAMAQESARRNGLAGRVHFQAGDVRDLPPEIPLQSFHHVIANPPFYDKASYGAEAQSAKGRAHALSDTTLADWVKAARRALRPQGTVTLILAVPQLPEALATLMAASFGGIELIPLWPRQGEAAKRALLRAKDQNHAPFRLAAGLVLHDQDGRATEAARRILEGGEGIGLKQSP